MLVRTMAPEIIACDEIGSKGDVEAIHYALYSGVKGIFTMHGKSVEDIKNWSNKHTRVKGETLYKILKTFKEHHNCKFMIVPKKDMGKTIVDLLTKK